MSDVKVSSWGTKIFHTVGPGYLEVPKGHEWYIVGVLAKPFVEGYVPVHQRPPVWKLPSAVDGELVLRVSIPIEDRDLAFKDSPPLLTASVVTLMDAYLRFCDVDDVIQVRRSAEILSATDRHLREHVTDENLAAYAAALESSSQSIEDGIGKVDWKILNDEFARHTVLRERGAKAWSMFAQNAVSTMFLPMHLTSGQRFVMERWSADKHGTLLEQMTREQDDNIEKREWINLEVFLLEKRPIEVPAPKAPPADVIPV